MGSIFPDNDYVRQVDHIGGYWNPKRKLGVTTHFSEITVFLNMEKNDKKVIFPQISACTRELAQMQWYIIVTRFQNKQQMIT